MQEPSTSCVTPSRKLSSPVKYQLPVVGRDWDCLTMRDKAILLQKLASFESHGTDLFNQLLEQTCNVYTVDCQAGASIRVRLSFAGHLYENDSLTFWTPASCDLLCVASHMIWIHKSGSRAVMIVSTLLWIPSEFCGQRYAIDVFSKVDRFLTQSF